MKLIHILIDTDPDPVGNWPDPKHSLLQNHYFFVNCTMYIHFSLLKGVGVKKSSQTINI